MDNLLFFIIIIIVIIVIFFIHYTAPNSMLSSESENIQNYENFDIFPNQDKISECTDRGDMLTLSPLKRCELMAKKKFMIRDLRTQLWLISGQEEGFNKFLPGRFGNVFMMSKNPDDYLPLRTIADPNDYLLATFTGNGIRTVSNPNSQYFIIQVFIYNGFNVLGYISESNTQLYLYIDNNGHITSHTNPESASKIEILEV